ncbi:hypothetical protein QBC40DRAFT_327774 [Triangularia verruculosa]|uniref:Prion-inhibition and propagation HeLo domain-containing protein n=1 Tax=Triangularia verruculosa TaxID=2587418 RepID=A0AAN6XG37_9PEZI|nr:hypothetical protein QBC40DRAFT_327774 [Triangularia verruculosa]
MADPVGAAAAAFTFAKVAYGCLVFIQELRSHTPQSFQRLALGLEAEFYRYRAWCDLVGLKEIGISVGNTDSWLDSAQTVKQLEEQLRQVLRFDSEHIAAMIIDELRNTEKEFIKAREKLGGIDATLPRKTSTSYSFKRPFLKLPWTKKAAQVSVSSSPVASTSEVASNKSYSTRTALKWELMDKKTFESLTKQIADLNNVLYTFLSIRDKTNIERRTTDAALQHNCKGVILGVETQNLVIIKTELEREDKLLNPGLEYKPNKPGPSSAQSDHETSFVFPTPVLDPEDFIHPLGIGSSRSFSSLEGQSVMIEWTYYSNKSLITVDQFSRKEKLVRLWNQANTSHTKLRTLQSIAIVADRKNSRVGLVLVVPGMFEPPLVQRSLLDLLGSKPIPIGHRFTIAKEFTTTVYRLHSIGWLHKSLRTDNLLCFGNQHNNTAAEPVDLSELSLSTAPQLYLSGWYLSRPDQPSELSQSISISRQGYALTKDLIRLSSHPDSFSAEAAESTFPRLRFQPEYDIYSCGLVLLQIGLWMALPALRDRCQSDDDFRQKAKGVYCDMLRNQMGEIYWRATKRCLHNNFSRRSTKLSGEEGDGEPAQIPLYVAFERQVHCKAGS